MLFCIIQTANLEVFFPSKVLPPYKIPRPYIGSNVLQTLYVGMECEQLLSHYYLNKQVTPRRRVPLEKSKLLDHSRHSQHFMEPEASIPRLY
jgi:hypothetical protein